MRFEHYLMRFGHYLIAETVRSMCIHYDYYTCGDNEAYSKMFEMCGEITEPQQVIKIAEDIKSHSHTEDTVEDIALLLLSRMEVKII